jgi:Xaa-Pro aminopeptidase
MVLADKNERTMEAKIDWTGRLQGAEDVRVLLARPKLADWALRPAKDAPIPPGDRIIVYLAASFERYWAEAVRTFIVADFGFSEVNDEKTNELYQEIIASVKPGKLASQFYKETMKAIRRKGFEYVSDYGLGHGIGLSSQELPLFDDKDTNPLAEGMSFVLRLAIRDREKGAIMTGNTVYLSEKGAEILTT